MSLNIKEESANTEVTNPETSQDAAVPSSSTNEGGEATQGSSDAAPAADATDGTPTNEEAEGEEDSGGEPPKAAASAFKPRDKFKVRNLETDSQDEIDVPAWLKSSLKDAETEKQALALLEKAHGLEPVKMERARAQQERDGFKTELSKVQTTIVKARQTYQRGDIDGFLDQLSIPHERMLQWALSKVEYSQLPPEQQRIIDERRDAQRQAWSAEEKAGQAQEQFHEQVRSAKQTLLNASLARPDVQAFADSYNQRAGKPDGFIAEVIATGELAWIQSKGKVDLSPDQAIELVMKKWSPFVQSGSSASATPSASAASSQAGPGTQATSASKPAVIPNLQGRPTTPLKSKPRSVEDLRKLSVQANSQ